MKLAKLVHAKENLNFWANYKKYYVEPIEYGILSREDLTEDDFAELSAKTELEDDNAPSSKQPSSSIEASFG